MKWNSRQFTIRSDDQNSESGDDLEEEREEEVEEEQKCVYSSHILFRAIANSAIANNFSETLWKKMVFSRRLFCESSLQPAATGELLFICSINRPNSQLQQPAIFILHSIQTNQLHPPNKYKYSSIRFDVSESSRAMSEGNVGWWCGLFVDGCEFVDGCGIGSGMWRYGWVGLAPVGSDRVEYVCLDKILRWIIKRKRK